MVIMNKYVKDMMHERELIYDAKKAIHEEDKKYKDVGEMKGSSLHMGHSPMHKHCTSALRYKTPMKMENVIDRDAKSSGENQYNKYGK